MKPLRSVLLPVLLALTVVGARPLGAQVTFSEQGSLLGLANSAYTISLSWSDWDGDGDPDLHFQNNAGARSVWYRNDGVAGFTDITTALGVGHTEDGWSGAWDDFDNDGDVDLLLGNEFDNILWRQKDDGTFENVTEPLGATSTSFSQGVAWVDYNMDGRLDMHLTMEFAPFRMLRQKADGTFEDVSAATGLNDAQSHSYGLSWADFDLDGDLDVAVTTCGTSQLGGITIDRLWRNNLIGTGQANFSEIASTAGTNYQGNMYGNEFADPDNDGDFDLFVAGATDVQSNRFYRNDGAMPFSEVAAAVGLAGPTRSSKGCEFVDYDNDGDLDLWVLDQSAKNQLYHNNLVESGTMTFTESWDALGFTALPGSGSLRGTFDGGWADVDGDGDLDLCTPTRSRNALYINNGGNANNWLRVELRGRGDTRSGRGALIRLRTGSTWQMRTHMDHTGAFSQNYLPTHFGLGEAETIDEIRVKWLTGGESVLTNVPANQRILIDQAQAGMAEGLIIR